MTDEVEIWLFVGAFFLIGVNFTLHWAHARHCKKVGEDIVEIKTMIQDTFPEIKTLRERSHDQTAANLRLDARVSVLEERTK